MHSVGRLSPNLYLLGWLYVISASTSGCRMDGASFSQQGESKVPVRNFASLHLYRPAESPDEVYIFDLNKFGETRAEDQAGSCREAASADADCSLSGKQIQLTCESHWSFVQRAYTVVKMHAFINQSSGMIRIAGSLARSGIQQAMEKLGDAHPCIRKSGVRSEKKRTLRAIYREATKHDCSTDSGFRDGELSFDHIVPSALNGNNAQSNLALAPKKFDEAVIRQIQHQLGRHFMSYDCVGHPVPISKDILPTERSCRLSLEEAKGIVTSSAFSSP